MLTPFGEELPGEMLDELSVFYVAVTRDRKLVYLSASLTRYNASEGKKSSRLSCFGKLPGIQLVKLSFEDIKM